MARRRLCAAVGTVVLVLAYAAVYAALPGSAQSAPPQGTITCRASALHLLGVEPLVANAAGDPCAGETRSLLDLPDPSLGLRSAFARTEPLASGAASAHAQVAGVDLALLGLQVNFIESRATVRCDGDQPRLEGASTVVGLVLNGQPVEAGVPASLALPVGTLHLNHSAIVDTSLLQRAVWLETGLGSIVLGEARVEYAGSPCGARETRSGDTGITVVKVAEPDSSANFPFTGDLGPFVLRDDGASGSDRRTFELTPGRYRVSELAPTGGFFPEAWFLRDVQCTDGETTINIDEGSVVVDLDAGEHVVCTFINLNPPFLEMVSAPLENPARGLDPVVFRQDQSTSPITTPRAAIATPRPPPDVDPGVGPTGGYDRSTGGAERSTDGSLLSASTAFIALPLVAVVAGGLWFLLAAGRRRRQDESG